MSELLTSVASLFGIINIFMGLIIIYQIIRRIFKPVLFKGKLCTFILAFFILAYIISGTDKFITEIEKKPPLFFLISLCCFIMLIIIKLKFVGRCLYSIKQLDAMDGHTFEHACSDILRANGFKNVKVTRASGDYGVDILAEKRGKKYAVQCKRYSHKLGNAPIQEVIGGLAYYNCQKGIVITNNYFTEPAKNLARVNNVELWDRDQLIKLSFSTNRKINWRAKRNKTDKKFTDLNSYSVNSQNIENYSQQADDTIPTSRVQENTEVLCSESALIPEPQDVSEIKLNINKPRKIINTELAEKYANKINREQNRKEFFELIEKFASYICEYAAYFYNEMNDLDVVIKKYELLPESKEIHFDISLYTKTRIHHLTSAKDELAEYLNVKYVKIDSSSIQNGTIGLVVPLPEYIVSLSLDTVNKT